MAKKEKVKPKRTPAQQKVIDDRMKAMRDARKKKLAASGANSSAAPAKAAQPTAGAFQKPSADLGKSASSVAQSTKPVAATAQLSQDAPTIKKWKIERLEDFAVLPRDQLDKAMHLTSHLIRKAHHHGKAVEHVVYTEQGRIDVQEVALDVDPLS